MAHIIIRIRQERKVRKRNGVEAVGPNRINGAREDHSARNKVQRVKRSKVTLSGGKSQRVPFCDKIRARFVAMSRAPDPCMGE